MYAWEVAWSNIDQVGFSGAVSRCVIQGLNFYYKLLRNNEEIKVIYWCI